MQDIATEIHAPSAASLMAWWHEMGVDCLVDDMPAPWLNRDSWEPKPNDRSATLANNPTEPAELPATLSAFTDWLMTSPDVPGTGPARGRIAPAGDAAAGLMVLVDMPDVGDEDRLMNGEAGLLFDRMLAAVGRDRQSVYLASVIPARPPSGMIDEATLPRLFEIARHHVKLAGPRLLWLMGGAPSRALTGMSEIEGRGSLHEINHASGTIDAMVSLHPRNLLQSPHRKAAVWADMLNLCKERPA